MGIFARIKKAWYDSIIWETIDEDFYDELEESLIMADLGAAVAADAVKELRKVVYEKSIQRGDDVKQALRDILEKKLEVGDTSLDLSTTPSVVLIIGVNGVGKTTSIGKLANRYKKQGKRVLLCAADTFRAAAADQLEMVFMPTVSTFAIAELLTMNNIKLFGTTVQENIYNGMWNYGAALSLIMLLLIGVTILFTNEEDGASNESGGVI